MSNQVDMASVLRDKGVSAATLSLLSVKHVDKGNLLLGSDPSWPAGVSWSDDRLVYTLKDMYGTFKGFAYRTPGLKFHYDTDFPVKPSTLLYGLDVAHSCIATSGYAIIVEGIFDFLKLYDSGITNVVSTLGTNLSWEQTCLLRRFCQKVVVVYDPDNAGRSAADKAAGVLREAGIQPSIVDLQDKDPDDYVAAYGKERFLSLCSQSLENTESVKSIYP